MQDSSISEQPIRTITSGQLRKKANWITVSLPRSLVHELRATSQDLGVSVVSYVEVAHKAYVQANPKAPA